MLSAILLMLEVQTRWWKPALGDIGWHSGYLIDAVIPYYLAWLMFAAISSLCFHLIIPVGLWNLVGAVGFMICGAFGYSPLERWVTQSGLSTFWGEFVLDLGIEVRSGTDK